MLKTLYWNKIFILLISVARSKIVWTTQWVAVEEHLPENSAKFCHRGNVLHTNVFCIPDTAVPFERYNNRSRTILVNNKLTFLSNSNTFDWNKIIKKHINQHEAFLIMNTIAYTYYCLIDIVFVLNRVFLSCLKLGVVIFSRIMGFECPSGIHCIYPFLLKSQVIHI